MRPITHIADLRAIAQRKLPRAIFDFIDRGSYDEITMNANRSDLDSLRLRQRVIVDVSKRSLATNIVGERATMPIAIALRVSPDWFMATERSWPRARLKLSAFPTA